MATGKKIGLITGPLLFLALRALPFTIISEPADAVIAVAVWMVVWWLTEAVSITVTALLPLVLFPFLGILPMDQVGANYGSPIVFLFFGGFVLALALEKVNLHRRIALNIIRVTGTSPNRVVLGFMVATAVLSMWISNTASTVVMLPIALSVIDLLASDADGMTRYDRNFALSVMLGIAFAANAGGIATLIGTPPNSVMVGLLEKQYHIEVSFVKWMLLGVPFSFVLLVTAYWVLVKWFYPTGPLRFTSTRDVIQNELRKLGPVSNREKQVMAVFALAIFLWIFRVPINGLWPSLGLTDPIISMVAAIALFAIPYNWRRWEFLIQWGDTPKLAWGILILFGGGLALAQGMSVSGVVDVIADRIAESNLGILPTAVVLIALMLFMTELMSNVALMAVLAPVVAGIAVGLDVPVIQLLVPVTMASSCAFMLPMATPPNAIVFASGYVKVAQMARVGIVMNLISVGLLILVFQFFVPIVFP